MVWSLEAPDVLVRDASACSSVCELGTELCGSGEGEEVILPLGLDQQPGYTVTPILYL